MWAVSDFYQPMLMKFLDVIKTTMGLALGMYMLWENKRRNRSQATGGTAFNEHEGQRLSLLDKTEFVSLIRYRVGKP